MNCCAVAAETCGDNSERFRQKRVRRAASAAHASTPARIAAFSKCHNGHCRGRAHRAHGSRSQVSFKTILGLFPLLPPLMPRLQALVLTRPYPTNVTIFRQFPPHVASLASERLEAFIASALGHGSNKSSVYCFKAVSANLHSSRCADAGCKSPDIFEE